MIGVIARVGLAARALLVPLLAMTLAAGTSGGIALASDGHRAGNEPGSGSALTHHFPLGGRRLRRPPTPSGRRPPRTAPRDHARPATTFDGQPAALLAAEIIVGSLLVLALTAFSSWTGVMWKSGLRTVHRPRRAISPRLVVLLSPLVRYSVVRRAYVLRLVGDRLGPVLVKRSSSR